MHDNHDIERMFEDTPKPSVVNGSHRLRLKHALLQEMKKENVPMRSWKKTLVWAACFVMIIALSAWAIQKVYMRFTVQERIVGVFEEENGHLRYRVTNNFTIKTLDIDPGSEDAGKICSEIKNLILGGKYTLVEDTLKPGDNQSFHYSITLADGDVHSVETNRPLEDIIDEYGKDIKVGDIHMGENTLDLGNGRTLNIEVVPKESAPKE